jgi:hypothetical protein
MEIPEQIFLKIKSIIENSQSLIFVFPAMTVSDLSMLRISSSTIEIVFALGLRKNIVILYEKSEKEKLPKNLVALNKSRIFPFEATNKTPIKTLFNSFENETDIKNLLKLK